MYSKSFIFQFETISQPSPAPSLSRGQSGSTFKRLEVETASSTKSTTPGLPEPTSGLSVSRSSSGRSRISEAQEWDVKLRGKRGNSLMLQEALEGKKNPALKPVNPWMKGGFWTMGRL